MVIAHNLVDYTFDSTSGLGSERKRKNHVSFLLAKNCFGDQGLATIGKQLRFTDLIIQCRNSQKNQLNFIRILASQTQFRADNKI
jgi:hypothetical protein